VARFMTDRLSDPWPSPAIFEQIGERFRAAVRDFAETKTIPLIHFKKGDRLTHPPRPPQQYVRAHPEGVRWALFYTKLRDRLLWPLRAADQPATSVELCRALRVIDDSVDHYVDAARMKPAA